MMLPTLKPLHDAAIGSFAQAIEQDIDGTVFRNLLDVVQEVCKFVAAFGLTMIQAYVEVRFRQTKATRRICSCGKAMEWHSTSEWFHGTQFGDVRVKDAYAYCRACHKS